MKLSKNAQLILKKRYLKRDDSGNVMETPEDMFLRVARVVASAENKYAEGGAAYWREPFYRAMTGLEFIPNSPTLFNAGRKLGLLSSCFVLPVKDSVEEIYETLSEAAHIHKHGGGTAFSFAAIRPEGDAVSGLSGVAGGPAKLVNVFSVATDYVRQAGVRSGCNSACLPAEHPDILRFIEAKSDGTLAPNFAINVVMTDEFVEKIKNGDNYDLVNPRSGAACGKLNAREVLKSVADNAWKNGEPGVLFIDRINRDNSTPHLGDFETTDPCGGQPLLPFESSNLGTINLTLMLRKEGGSYDIDYSKLGETVLLAIRFLDDVIDVNIYPLPEVAETSLKTRRIGLGVMGFAEMLIKMGIRYDSERALEVADELMHFVRDEALSASSQLASERGSFPAYKGSFYHRQGLPMRNAACLTMTNTGTSSLIADTTSGIHPIYSLVMVRNILDGSKLLDINRLFEECAKDGGFFSQQLVNKLLCGASLKECDEVPAEVRNLFVTAPDISPEACVRMQAVFQKNIDNAITQTVNFPSHATPEDIAGIFLKAHELGLKGLAVYRDTSREVQVLCRGDAYLGLVEDYFTSCFD